MKLQFAFGANPRKKKKVATRHKKRKNKKSKKLTPHKGRAMAKRKKARRRKVKAHSAKKTHHKRKRKLTRKGRVFGKRKRRSKKNPFALRELSGKVMQKSKAYPGAKWFERGLQENSALVEAYKSLGKDAAGNPKLVHEIETKLANLKRKIASGKALQDSEIAANQKWLEQKEAAIILQDSKYEKNDFASPFDRKRRGKKVAKKTRKKAKKRVTKRKSKKAKKRYYPKMLSHKHAKSTRHIAKGAVAKAVSSKKKKSRSYKIKTSFGKGKRKVRMTGRASIKKGKLHSFFKINPFRRNPMANVAQLTETYTGLDMTEMSALAAGGALVPVINSLVAKYIPNVAAKISSYVGPQAIGSVIPMLAGLSINAVAEHALKGKPAAKYAEIVGEGLVTAGIIGLTMSLSQRFLNPALGLSGINFTPMNGVNFTPMAGMPQLGSINYTPMAGMPQLGAADYNGGGYTEDHRFSKADFGRGPDFGGFAMDEDSDESVTEDDMTDSAMGAMG